jgi:8-oxo-dGTP pyrophosphatase MutT (NUDIX family)
VFDGALDSEELGVLPAYSKDVGLAVGYDPEVVVRNAAAERLYFGPPAGPDALDDLLDPHRAILDWGGMAIPLVRHPESVIIIPVDDGEVVLVSQTRPGAGTRLLELPAGALEPGETPGEAARRELAEECGLAAESWQAIGGFWAVPAYSTEFSHVFLATGLSVVDSTHLDQDEDIEVERVPQEEALATVADGGSIAALALWRRL